MADQPSASAPRTEEEMRQEDAVVNPPAVADPPEPGPTDPPAEPTQPEPEEPDFAEDDRAKMFDRLDAENAKRGQQKAVLFSDEPLEEDAPPGSEHAPPPAAAEAPAAEPPATEPETPQGPVVVSRAEFLEIFKDYRIKDKVSGEMVEAPVDEWISGTGLERHYTKRLMDVSRKEREVLSQAAKPPPVPQKTPEEIQARYDELFMESPYKAKQFLDEVEAQKKAPSESPEDETLRARKAYEEFASAYPGVSQEDWARMNNPVFWQKYPDIVEARSRKEWFPVFVLAYNKLQRENLDLERHAIQERLRKEKGEEGQKIIERKKAGAVIRTAAVPPRTPAATARKVVTQEEDRRAYISELRKASRARMNIR